MFMDNESAIANERALACLIFSIRGLRVMLDGDLAKIFGVTTRRLNEQLRRNLARFPSDFAFQLTERETAQIRSQIATGSEATRSQIATGLKFNPSYRPFAFTEHGAIMLATVLNSPVAVEASVRVVRAFVLMRELMAANRAQFTELAKRIDQLDARAGNHDKALRQVFDALRQIMTPPTRAIGFHVRHEPKSPSGVPPNKAAKR